MARRASTLAACCVIALVTACGADEPVAVRSFCDSMERITELLEPQTALPTRQDTRERYVEVVAVLDAAQRDAPAALKADVTTFATAIDRFTAALAALDHDIDALFRTRAGVQLGEETSHALTPAIVEHLSSSCELAFEPS